MRHRETEREREAETQAEGEAGSMHREPNVGFDPGSPGSHPGPKAGAKPLRHPGIPRSFYQTKPTSSLSISRVLNAPQFSEEQANSKTIIWPPKMWTMYGLDWGIFTHGPSLEDRRPGSGTMTLPHRPCPPIMKQKSTDAQEKLGHLRGPKRARAHVNSNLKRWFM